jgi:hypothetical protein
LGSPIVIGNEIGLADGTVATDVHQNIADNVLGALHRGEQRQYSIDEFCCASSIAMVVGRIVVEQRSHQSFVATIERSRQLQDQFTTGSLVQFGLP